MLFIAVQTKETENQILNVNMTAHIVQYCTIDDIIVGISVSDPTISIQLIHIVYVNVLNNILNIDLIKHQTLQLTLQLILL